MNKCKNKNILYFKSMDEAKEYRKLYLEPYISYFSSKYLNKPIKDSSGRIRINIKDKYSNGYDAFKGYWQEMPYFDLVTQMKRNKDSIIGIINKQ
jgi:hypothetical protein